MFEMSLRLSDAIRVLLPICVVTFHSVPASFSAPEHKAAARDGQNAGNDKQSGALAASSSSASRFSREKDPLIVAYVVDLQKRITRAWFPPAHSQGLKAEVGFQVQADGRLSELAVSRSSGSQAFDKACLHAPGDAGPFKPLPRENRKSLGVKVTFENNARSGHAILVRQSASH